MIEFIKLHIDRYKSIAFMELDFTDFDNITQLRGKTGCGKTSIIESFVWALYGANLKGLNASDVASKVFDNGTMVEVTFIKDGIEYRVARTHNYKDLIHLESNGVSLFIDGEQYQSENKTDCQNKIDSIIGIDVDLFLKSVFFPQRTVKLAEYANKDIKKVFDAILDKFYDVDFLETLQERVVETLNHNNNKLTEVTNDTVKLDTQIEAVKTAIKKDKEYRRTFEEQKQERIDRIKAQIKECRDFISQDVKKVDINIDKTESKKSKNKKTLQQYEKVLRDHKNESAGLTKEINFYKQEIDSGNCARCDQPLKKTKDIKENLKQSENLLEQTNDVIETTQKEIAKLKKKISKLENKIDRYNKSIRLTEKIKNKKENLEEYKLALNNEEDYEMKSDDSKENKAKIKTLKNKLKKATKQCSNIEKQIEHLTWWKNVALGAGGIKTYLFNSMLDELNVQLLNYTQPFGMTLYMRMVGKVRKSLEINIEKDDGVLYTYAELSGGEKSLVDIAFGLALNDLMDTVSFNIMVFDEYFEGIDSESVSMAFELLRIKAKDSKIILISHNDLSEYGDIAVIKVSKKNKITQIT